MLHKTCPVRVKLLDSSPAESSSGVFEALVSVFGNVDVYGDRVMPGAFTRTLDDWGAKGDPIPVYWSHQLSDPDMNIGHVLEAKEIDKGLWIKAQLDPDSPKAMTTLRLMKGGRVNQFSFSYGIAPDGIKEADDGAFELSDLDLYEVGPTPVGANPATELLTVKSHLLAVKAGRVLSSANESLVRSARDALTSLLDSLSSEDDSGKASRASRIKDEARQGKSEESHAQRSAPAWSSNQFLLDTLEAAL